MKYDVTCSYGYDTKPEYNYNITTDGNGWVHIPPVGTSDFPIGISSSTTSTTGKTVNINAPQVEWGSLKTTAATTSAGITYNPNSTTTTTPNTVWGGSNWKVLSYDGAKLSLRLSDDVLKDIGENWDKISEIYEQQKEKERAAELKKVQERNARLRGLIEKITFSGPVTVIKWSDGTITRVRCADDEEYDKEKGVLAAMAKKLYENTNIFVEELYNWCLEEEEIEVKEETSPKISEKDYRILKKLFK